MENWLVGPWMKVRRKAGRSRRWTPPVRIAHRRWAKSGLQAVPQGAGSDWLVMARVGLDNAKTVMASLARPPAAGLGSQSVLAAIPEVYLYGLYESPAWTHSPIGSWSADPLQYRLRYGPDYEPTVVGSHVARNNRRPIP